MPPRRRARSLQISENWAEGFEGLTPTQVGEVVLEALGAVANPAEDPADWSRAVVLPNGDGIYFFLEETGDGRWNLEAEEISGLT